MAAGAFKAKRKGRKGQTKEGIAALTRGYKPQEWMAAFKASGAISLAWQLAKSQGTAIAPGKTHGTTLGM